MYSAVLIDDDPNLIKGIKELLKKYAPEITILAEANNVSKGIEIINKHKPQLIFLDIHLGDGTGFDILEKTMKGKDKIESHVVFITAHEQYALKAFKFSALDYLLKPVDPDELIDTVNKIKDKLQNITSYGHLDLLIENLKQKNSSFKRIALATSEGIHLFDISDIIRCESSDNYTTFFIKNQKPLLISKTLKEYEELLSNHGFERIHQSHLINLAYLKTYIKSDGGYVIMTDGSNIPISQRKKDRLQNILKII